MKCSGLQKKCKLGFKLHDSFWKIPYYVYVYFIITANDLQEVHIELNMYIQGISHWTVLYELALKDRNMQVKSCLKVVLECRDDKFFIYILGF